MYGLTNLEETVLERFELLEELGSGSFGVVYRVFDKKRQATAALKTLQHLEPRYLYRFKREFRSLADITHPNLVDLYELVVDDDDWFFTMSYVEGVDFLTALRQGHPDKRMAETVSADGDEAGTVDVDSPLAQLAESALDESSVEQEEGLVAQTDPQSPHVPLDYDAIRNVLRGLVTGVRALHRYGMLHRDLKPANVLVTSDGHPVVLDFGLVTDLDARPIKGSSDDENSGVNGTPTYVAPEAAQGVTLDEASDWYSIGVMLYEVLTGRVPFKADTPVGQLYQKNQTEPAPVKHYRPDTDPELARLCMDLLATDPEDRPTGDEILERLGAENDDSPTGLRTTSQARDRSGMFVGRANSMKTLREVAEETAKSQQPGLVDIHGDSGVGKTALAENFLNQWEADHPDTAVLRGHCYETESVPYKALDGVVDELVPWVEQLPTDELTEILGNRAQALAQLFPVLAQIDAVFKGQSYPSAVTEAQRRHDAFTALSQVLRRLATERPVIILIDDVQWGDEDSVRLLEHILQTKPPPGIMLIMTWRTEDADASSFLGRYLTLRRELEERLRVTDIQLDELSASDARKLARRVMSRASRGGEASEADVDHIVHESGGNPLFIDELSRHTAESGNVDSDITNFDAILERRLDDLEDQTRRALDVVAVAGRPISRELLRRVGGDHAAGPSTLSRLRSNRLTRAIGTQGERLEPYHDRIRDVLVDRLDPGMRREIHLELARAIKATRNSDPETIGFHLEAADRPEKAASYYVDAADAAADNLAFDLAAQLFERALELGRWSAYETAELQQQLGDMYAALGRSERAADAYFEAADNSDGLDVRECRIQAVEQMLRAGEVKTGTDQLYGELDALGFSPVNNRGLLVASALYQSWKLERRGFDFELRRPETLDRRRRLLVEALTMATLMYGITDVTRGTYFHYNALPLALETGYPSRLALLLCQQVAQDAAIRSNPERGEDFLETARELVSECRHEPGRVRAYIVMMEGLRDYFYSRWTSARSSMNRAREIADAEMPGSVWWSAVYRFFECDCLHRMGAFDKLRELVPKAFEDAREREDDFNTVLFRPKRALLALCDDDPDRAAGEIERAEREWTQEGHHLHDFWRERAAVDTDLYRGDLQSAWRRMREEWSNLRRSLLIQSFPLRTFAWGLDGRIAAALVGQASGWQYCHARYRAWRAQRVLRAIDTPCSVAFADLVEGQLAIARSQLTQADEALERAQSEFDDADMAFHGYACRFVRAQLNDDETKRQKLDEEARDWMNNRGIVAPEKMTRLVIPRPPHAQLDSS